jgi:hypothetical protein
MIAVTGISYMPGTPVLLIALEVDVPPPPPRARQGKARQGKVLIIGGGIANFTDVAATFKGIQKALAEYRDKHNANNDNGNDDEIMIHNRRY